MLNKKICKKCCMEDNSYRISWVVLGRRFGQNWKRGVAFPCRTRFPKWMNSLDGIPEKCPYRLEQLLAQQKNM